MLPIISLLSGCKSTYFTIILHIEKRVEWMDGWEENIVLQLYFGTKLTSQQSSTQVI